MIESELKISANEGDVDSIYKLGRLYIEVKSENKEQGLKLCQLAAERKNIDALQYLSDYFYKIDKQLSSEYELRAFQENEHNEKYDNLCRKKEGIDEEEFYQKIQELAANSGGRLARVCMEERFLTHDLKNKEVEITWLEDCNDKGWIFSNYKLAKLYSEGLIEDKPYRVMGSEKDITEYDRPKEKEYLKAAIEICFKNSHKINIYSFKLISLITEWLEKNIDSYVHLISLGQLYFNLSKLEVNEIENIKKSFNYFLEAAKQEDEDGIAAYYCGLLLLTYKKDAFISEDDLNFISTSLNKIAEKNNIQIRKNTAIVVARRKREHGNKFTHGIRNEVILFANGFSLKIKNQEINQLNQKLLERNEKLNNLIAMFAHNFLGTLQCIRSNAEHDNNPNIHLKTVKMMGGALTAFSIISADDDKLIEQLQQDSTGESNLLQCLANNLALAISQLLSKTNKDKIINIYLNYLKKTGQIKVETNDKELRIKGNRKKWQTLQHQWEDEFNALFSEQVELSELIQWIKDNFFAIEIIGFDDFSIHFKEYGITDSIFLIVLMETFVNALKYMDVKASNPLTLSLCKQNNVYQLSCENPSQQEGYRGTHKGMDFLQTIANKLNGEFISESTKNTFKTTFRVPTQLLD